MTPSSSGALSPELLAEVKRLHFQTKKLADDATVGRYRSAFRGTGMEFEEVREYVPGDDIRRINWKVTAKAGRPYIKSYREERELTVILAVDTSSSTLSGTRGRSRHELIARVGAFLTLIALNNNDKVGLVTFSSAVERYLPARKTRGAVWQMLHEVMNIKPQKSQTSITVLCQFLNSVLKRRAVIFIISDFLAKDYQLPLSALARKHDVTAISINDPADLVLPEGGLTKVVDPESGVATVLDLGDKHLRKVYQTVAKCLIKERDDFFRRYKLGHISLETNQDYLPSIRKFFQEKSLPHRILQRPS